MQSQSNLADWLVREPFALCLSSGFFSFFAHAGMVSALAEAAIRPACITGSSAGALVGAAWASGMDSQTLREAIFALTKTDFWDPGFGAGLLRGQRLQQLLGDILPVSEQQDCPIECAISVWDVFGRRTVVFREGELAANIHASCAVPLLFHPVRIRKRYYLDGGIADRAGMAGVRAGTRILHHHILSRSPWRRKNSEALVPAAIANTATIAINDLPRCGPQKLHHGPTAWQAAYDATSKLLEQPIRPNIHRSGEIFYA